MKKLIYIPVAAGVLAFGGIVLANSETPTGDSSSKTGAVAEVQASSTTKKMISFEEASAKALDLANGRITDIELDKDDRRPHYDIDVDFDGYEYDFEFDAYTGEVLEQKREKDRDANVKPSGPTASDNRSDSDAVSEDGDLIGSDKAIEAALAAVGGTVEGIELEREDGIAYYEVELKEGRSEHEVDVNAKDGSILKVDSDTEDDNDDDDDNDDWD